MLLCITYSGENASDLGYLLYKNPSRNQSFDLSFGRAYVFYPEVSADCCTAAMLLEIDPLDLAKGKPGARGGGLFDYVSDRPYVSSSFMSTAIARVFGTAMSGRCDSRQTLADSDLDLRATVTMLPCRDDPVWLEKIFAPLGYEVKISRYPLDEQSPEWGISPYVDLAVHGKVRLRDLLTHLYVLIPVFDQQKHYWVGQEEVEKLLKHGAGWLEQHPEKAFIANRYFNRQQRFAHDALEQLENSTENPPENDAEENANTPRLNTQRLEAVREILAENGAHSVIDLGCGDGKLLKGLLQDTRFTRIAGSDVSCSTLERARRRLRLDDLPDRLKDRVTLFQSSLTYVDERFAGYDAAVVMEVVEHLDPNRLETFKQVLFGEARPTLVVLTTPNMEFNENYRGIEGGALRHSDHRFEFTREAFQSWADSTARQYGYTVEYKAVGDIDGTHGAPTQMGVFTRCA
jgi:3' terminal RNA ribose 2'-O-methyltransferase Hen1